MAFSTVREPDLRKQYFVKHPAISWLAVLTLEYEEKLDTLE